MKHIFTALIALLLTMASCSEETKPEPFSHTEGNGIYYWKTTVTVNDSLVEFINSHNIRRMYIRLFDVVKNNGATPGEEAVVPNASLKFLHSDPYDRWTEWTDSLSAGTMFIPTVFITTDALWQMEDNLADWAEKIVTRALNMCSYNRIPKIEGLQLDCDWTGSTEELYFKLCHLVGVILKDRLRGAKLSCTIRLHQLAKDAPPVDYGVLMVYNTGDFNDPDTRNSIIDKATVEPYLKRLPDYPLHLDVAYPTYSWNLLFRHRQFRGIIREINLADTSAFARTGTDIFKVKRPVMNGRLRLEEGDMVRRECSRFKEVAEVKSMIEKRLRGKAHSNILYHLDYDNLSKFTNNEIDSLYSVNN